MSAATEWNCLVAVGIANVSTNKKANPESISKDSNSNDDVESNGQWLMVVGATMKKLVTTHSHARPPPPAPSPAIFHTERSNNRLK